jgi:hypothetical protein
MMIPINNSDTAWLIVSDYNQDNGKHYECLREDILNPEINDWIGEIIYFGIGCNNRGYPHLVNPVGSIPTGHHDFGGIVGSGVLNERVGSFTETVLAGAVIGGHFVGVRWWTDNNKH